MRASPRMIDLSLKDVTTLAANEEESLSRVSGGEEGRKITFGTTHHSGLGTTLL